MTEITPQELRTLIQSWKDRAEAQGYKKGTRTYLSMELEFFMGAFAMLLVLGRSHPPFLEFIVMEGGSLAEVLSPDEEASND